MELTTKNITFLRDIHSRLNVDMTSGWRYFYFSGALSELASFIRLMEDDKIYLLIPLFGSSKSLSDATLNLSEPFFVNNKSNGQLIINFIAEQWESSAFNLKPDKPLSFRIKYKRVWLWEK